MCNVVPYKLKEVYIEDDILNYSLIRNNIHAYPSEDKTVVMTTDISKNSISERKYLVLLSLHIGGTKYRIKSSKIETSKNITIHNMNESIEYNTVFEVTDDEG